MLSTMLLEVARNLTRAANGSEPAKPSGCTTRAEIFAGAMARFLSNPPPLRKVVRLNRQLQREARRQTDDRAEDEGTSLPARGRRKGVPVRRWTSQMIEILAREYPTKPFPELAAALGVPVKTMRLKASRLGIRRLPEVIVAEAVAVATVAKQQAFG